MEKNMSERAYPDHLYEPLRREIAVQYLRHELRKLFASIRDEGTWRSLDEDVSRWFDADPELAPVRDFWNGLHGISMGFKLKNIVSWLTSKNLQWEKVEVPVAEIIFGSILEEIAEVSGKPTGESVRKWFFSPERASTLVRARAAHEVRSARTAPRDENRVIIVRRDGKLVVTDGNRRVLRAVLMEKETIAAYVGEALVEPILFESWVPTQSLSEIAGVHRLAAVAGRELTAQAAAIIVEMIRMSTAGRNEFVSRVLRKEMDADRRLYEAVHSLLLKEHITLPELE